MQYLWQIGEVVDGPGNSADTKTLHGVTYDYGTLLNLVRLLCFFLSLMDLLSKTYMHMD